MVAKRHKITNVPLFKKLWDIIFFFWDNNFLSHFSGHFEGASTFLTPKLSRAQGSKKSWPPRNGSKSYCPAKKNYVSQFLKQRDINSYCLRVFAQSVYNYRSKVVFFTKLPVQDTVYGSTTI